VTRADRLRFLYDYLRRGSIGDDASLRKQVRHMTALISRRTRRMARHDAARERRTEQG